MTGECVVYYDEIADITFLGHYDQPKDYDPPSMYGDHDTGSFTFPERICALERTQDGIFVHCERQTMYAIQTPSPDPIDWMCYKLS